MPGADPGLAAAAPPLLSLCLATCNRARYLDRYLTHHLQAFDAAGLDYELVVSDNGSTDATPAILAGYAARHPRMRVFRQPHNVGVYPNILATLRQARGEVAVSIADDDLAIPGKLIEYALRLRDDPALVMIQAPWLLMDEARGGAIAGKFYDFPGERRFARGDYAACLGFVIEHHVFPECWLVRRSALAAIAGPVPRFAYSFFCMLANALGQGEVLFSPEPHLMATAGAAGQTGNAEAMESWDAYRGGLEWLASLARQFNPGVLPDAQAVGGSILAFTAERMAVAARLQAHAGNWSNAYQLLRRLHAYGVTPDIDHDPGNVAVLAAVETALLECAQLGAAEIVVADAIPDHVLASIRPVDGAAFIRPGAAHPHGPRRGWCLVGADADASMRPEDFSCDLALTMERFPRLPAGT